MCIVNGWPSVGLHIYLDVLVYKSAGLDIGLGLDTADTADTADVFHILVKRTYQANYTGLTSSIGPRKTYKGLYF